VTSFPARNLNDSPALKKYYAAASSTQSVLPPVGLFDDLQPASTVIAAAILAAATDLARAKWFSLSNVSDRAS